MESNARPRRILRLPEVIHLCGIKRSTIYLWMSTGAFPKAKQIGPSIVGWDSLEIDQWISARLNGEDWKPEGEA
ncbi:AlpA family transcriptional regulator [Pseudomonas sp. PDM19]|uniref:AlpA family transcriptional regulator n=1 Tax=Pseudomonas sp. PDM19 TaxID=2769272 RepID=UPI00177EBB50|nr:AlpA family transcriptional regulator [Pseudomonas sp. PDM19]MBD9632872.1 AlpA family transcriptional regulator [Pseudomonas sp. PDM19]